MKRLIGLITTLCLLAIMATHAHAAGKEYLIKAAFVYNFTKFTKWPESTTIQEEKKLNFCINGTNTFSEAASIFKKASEKSIAIDIIEKKQWKKQDIICHMMFFTAQDNTKWRSELNTYKKHPILTIGEEKGFAKNGGIIEFVKVDNKIKLIINNSAAKDVGLRLDPQLLEIAIEVLR